MKTGTLSSFAVCRVNNLSAGGRGEEEAGEEGASGHRVGTSPSLGTLPPTPGYPHASLTSFCLSPLPLGFLLLKLALLWAEKGAECAGDGE